MHEVVIPQRTLLPYAEFVERSDLVVGDVYYFVKFVDEALTIPVMTPLVFIGPSAMPEKLVFQEVAVKVDAQGNVQEGHRHRVSQDVTGVFTFDRALDEILRCSARRGGVVSS